MSELNDSDPVAVLVTGSRGWTDAERVYSVLSGVKPSLIIQGGARGADRMAGAAGRRLGIGSEVWEADWDRFGRSAGHRRNEQMVERLVELAAMGWQTVVIAFWDGSSPGTRGCMEYAAKRGVHVRVERP